MAFMALFGWMFLPLFLVAAVIWLFQSALLWVMTHTLLINIAAALLLAVNLLLLTGLLRIRSRRKREGVKKYRLLLLLGALGAGWTALLCGLYLVVQPLQYIPIEKLPVDVGRDYAYSRELLHGTWTITACQGKAPDCTLTEEEIGQFIGWQITYSADRFSSPDGTYPLEPSYAYQRDVVGQHEFFSRYGMELEELGIYNRRNLDFVHLFLPEESFYDTPLGKELFIWNKDTLLICRDGVFLRAEREGGAPS